MIIHNYSILLIYDLEKIKPNIYLRKCLVWRFQQIYLYTHFVSDRSSNDNSNLNKTNSGIDDSLKSKIVNNSKRNDDKSVTNGIYYLPFNI